ncbi:AraC family transcriptional regulator [Pseudomonas lactucae]|uniref:AraC family transcriptional regulator n=3 Tax=Pseudomonas TaxID=286 RepID=UPI0019671C48|nr:AraC family transcriptional regulator [Pseudomonas lactucae]MBN2985296.1 helix-turn-helix domain-containing protein [Pseudomonas lactucae]
MHYDETHYSALVVERQLTNIEGEGEPHRHPVGQFVLVKKGMLYGHTQDQRWLLKPGMAVWIPPQTLHAGVAYSQVDLTVLYLGREQSKDFSTTLKLIEASALVIALCDRLAEEGARPLTEVQRSCILQLLLQDITELPASNMVLPLPSDGRLKRVTDQLIARPGLRKSLAEWGGEVGATERTLTRLFRKETGLCYTQWYNRLLLVEAYRGLMVEHTNERLAHHLGFASSDSFGHWFRRVTGSSPGKVRSTLQGAAAKAA